MVSIWVCEMQKSSRKSSRSHQATSAPSENQTSELDELRAILREKDDQHARTLADFDNYRKRVAKEGDAAAKTGIRDLLMEILRVQDSFDRAFQSEALKADPQVYQGVRSIQRQVHQLLEKQGVMSFESAGQAFDPSLHEAVGAQQSQRFADGTILREVQKGYVWEGKILRPAKVVVAGNTPTSSTANEID
jgi:molecular chaperone GrpE